MTDRELLELAAKAAGLKVKWHSKSHFGPTMEIMEDESGGSPWNPLTDDGDALRLAVKIHFTCRHFMGETVAQSTVPGGPSVYVTDTCHRRARVRAAAEIGRQMTIKDWPMEVQPDGTVTPVDPDDMGITCYKNKD